MRACAVRSTGCGACGRSPINSSAKSQSRHRRLSASAGHDSKRRRDLIAAALGVSVRTVVSLIVRGRRSLELASQMANAAAVEAEKTKTYQSISAPPLATGTTLPDLAKATVGTQFDSRERRRGIAAI